MLEHVLAELEVATEVPVLIAIDNANAWDQDSPFHDPDTRFKHLHASRLQGFNGGG